MVDCGVDRIVFFFVFFFFGSCGDDLVLTSGAGRPRSAPVVPIFRSRSRRESAATATSDLLTALHVVHDGRGHLLYRVSYLQLLIRCLLLLLLLRNKDIAKSISNFYQRFIIDAINLLRFKLIFANESSRMKYLECYF